jgi:hypothetical protein
LRKNQSGVLRKKAIRVIEKVMWIIPDFVRIIIESAYVRVSGLSPCPTVPVSLICGIPAFFIGNLLLEKEECICGGSNPPRANGS